MTTYEKSLTVLTELFARDCTFSLATAKDNVPSLRVVDTYYQDGAFWIVTYGMSHKVQDILSNPHVALCNGFYSFTGLAHHAGHPLKEQNKAIRETLIREFAPWYFAHNNEQDENMCYVRVDLTAGFFCKDGTGYKVDFVNRTADEFPFARDTESV